MSRAALDKKPHEVAAMFDGVAAGYDRTNTVLSFGQDRLWRRATRLALDLQPGQRVLDLAAGTGVSTRELARSGAYAVGVDISLGMLRAGRTRAVAAGRVPGGAQPEPVCGGGSAGGRPGQAGRSPSSREDQHPPTLTDVPLLAGDALALPFRDGAFDAVTISFGLRNVHDPVAALREMARVTRPGGRLVVCEFSHPTWAPFRAVYLEYLMRALPSIARRVASNPDAYVYLAESIRAWPEQPALAELVSSAGWGRVAWRNLTGGVVTLHRAIRD